MMALSPSDKKWCTDAITRLLQDFHVHAARSKNFTGVRAEACWKELREQLEDCHDQVRAEAQRLGHTLPARQ